MIANITERMYKMIAIDTVDIIINTLNISNE